MPEVTHLSNVEELSQKCAACKLRVVGEVKLGVGANAIFLNLARPFLLLFEFTIHAMP
jgi:hypothetical protein